MSCFGRVTNDDIGLALVYLQRSNFWSTTRVWGDRLQERAVFVGPTRLMLLRPLLESQEKHTLTLWVAVPWESVSHKANFEQPDTGLLAFATLDDPRVFCYEPLRFRPACGPTTKNWARDNESQNMIITPADNSKEVKFILPSSTKGCLYRTRYDGTLECGDAVYDRNLVPLALFLGADHKTNVGIVLDGDFIERHVSK